MRADGPPQPGPGGAIQCGSRTSSAPGQHTLRENIVIRAAVVLALAIALMACTCPRRLGNPQHPAALRKYRCHSISGAYARYTPEQSETANATLEEHERARAGNMVDYATRIRPPPATPEDVLRFVQEIDATPKCLGSSHWTVRSVEAGAEICGCGTDQEHDCLQNMIELLLEMNRRYESWVAGEVPPPGRWFRVLPSLEKGSELLLVDLLGAGASG